MAKRGKPITWLNEFDFMEKFHVLVPRPQRCVCGMLEYRFSFRKGKSGGHGTLYAFCCFCDSWLYYSPKRGKWVFLIPGVYSSRYYE